MTVLPRGVILGKYHARIAQAERDITAVHSLRARTFRRGVCADADQFDEKCTHFIVEDQRNGAVVCCFRLLLVTRGDQIHKSYSSQYYGLSALTAYDSPMLEMGRFCIDSGRSDPDILRVAWAALTAYVDAYGIKLLFGCSSFEGTDAAQYTDTFAMLRTNHLAPKRWLPKIKAPQVVRFEKRLADRKKAILAMPPLLRSYLSMGGWVSDHAVVDRDLGTLHVFTGLEIAAIPAARKRLLRALLS